MKNMNTVICAVLAYCFVILAINSVVGLRGRELTAFCSLRTGSAGGLSGLSLQHLKDLIFQSRSAGDVDRLSPQEHKDLNSWISSPGILDDLGSQQLMEVICSDRAPGNLKVQITKTPFKFGYKPLDLLQMDISFKLPSDVTGGVVSLRYSLTDDHPEKTFIIRRPHDETNDPVVRVRDIISGERVYIDVQLFNQTGPVSSIVLNERISEGRLVKKSLNSSDTDYIYNQICLNGNRCQFGVDLRKKMEDKPFAAVDIVKNIETISDAKKKNKPTCTYEYYIYFIILTIIATAFCVLVIVAFIKLCWMKRDTPDILQVPLQPRNPFYVNLLFRKECQAMIDDLEQNHYELID